MHKYSTRIYAYMWSFYAYCIFSGVIFPLVISILDSEKTGFSQEEFWGFLDSYYMLGQKSWYGKENLRTFKQKKIAAKSEYMWQYLKTNFLFIPNPTFHLAIHYLTKVKPSSSLIWAWPSSAQLVLINCDLVWGLQLKIPFYSPQLVLINCDLVWGLQLKLPFYSIYGIKTLVSSSR